MLSFWERESFIRYNYIVIGGGIVGLSTAISLKEKEPQKTVLVLERGTLPTGASTKNAGFSCFGSLTEILSDLRQLPEQAVFDLVRLRWEGLQKLRGRLSDDGMGYLGYGGYELLREEDLGCLQEMDRVNELVFPLFRKPVYQLKNETIDVFGFNKDLIKGLIYNPFEGQIHTGKMMKNLQKYVQELGVDVYTGSSVSGFEESDREVSVTVQDGFSFIADKAAICTNAFTKQLIPETDLSPGRGVVLVTRPIPDLKLKGTFHYDEGYYYFRNFEDRVIFGGGRNLDLEGEASTSFEARDLILDKLKEDLKDIILPATPFEIDHSWVGIMAFGEHKRPVLKPFSDRVFMGVRLGGMGVAIGSQIGEQLAQMMQR